ncbi:MAG: hypothetical protein ACXVBZ_04545 [Flavisolibacter sp.]
MRAYPMITAFWLLPYAIFSQTNISGIVNSYYKVLGVNYSQSGLKLDNVTGLAANDRVMIVQMKGAAVNTTVTSNSFGSVTSLNDAGNYELATVCSVRSDSVFLLQQLLRTYSVSNKVQLVKIPRYVSANVTASLEPAAWDSVTGKGGVLAIIVSQTLTLNAPVSASAKGFKGGLFYQDGGGCATNAFQNYAYDPTPGSYFVYTNVQKGGWKGESVCDLPLSLDGGKGACANGGGGGNNHNNGGGGGSNLAAGGKGGDNQSTTGCAGQQAALGGYVLNSNSGAKIFCGGGGGAGHANNTVTSLGGGYGGGIIFIQAETLQSNGYTIAANGSVGGNTTGDGASGGGGGGTIILSVTNYSDAVSFEAKGGDGGNEDDELISGRCYGEGGGGGGGTIYFSGLQPAGTVTVTGGAKGAKLNSTCGTTTGANGNAGSLVANYSVMESTTLSGCNTAVLGTNWLYFKATTTTGSILLQWEVLNTSGSYFVVQRWNNATWTDIAQIPLIVNQARYVFPDPNPTPGIYQYRVKWVSNQTARYSPSQQVIIRAAAQVIDYDPVTTQIHVRGGIARNETFRIIDLYGNCIYQKQFTTGLADWQMRLPFLKSGMYIAQIGTAVTKFITNR